MAGVSQATAAARTLGVVNLRGQVIPVLDLPAIVGCKPQTGLNIMLVTEYARTTQAFAVESVEDIVRLDWKRLGSDILRAFGDRHDNGVGARPERAEQLAASMHPMRDSLRYGYHDRQEQLAEAVAFAVHFLQVTARTETADASLLDSYERLVPGTRAAARLLITSPAYELHPLARGVTLAKAAD